MQKRVKFPIALKLILMMASMLMAATVSVVFLATKLFIDDTTAFIQKSNSDIASQMSAQTYSYIASLINTLTTMTEMQGQKSTTDEKHRDLNNLFERSGEIVSISTWKKDETAPLYFSIRDNLTASESEFSGLKPSPLTFNGEGQVDIQKISVKGKPYLAISFPLVVNKAAKSVMQASLGITTPDKFIEMYGKKGVIMSYLVDRNGTVLAHPKVQLMDSGTSLKEVAIVKAMLESPINNNQMGFIDQDQKRYLGAFRQVGIAGIGVISQVQEDQAFATARRVQYRSMLVTGIILSLAFSMVYFFSTTITKPIRKLVHLTQQIASGKFDLEIDTKGSDELTELTKAFGSMTDGLKERDKVKQLFGKFHGSDIADQLMKGNITLGGEQRQATVYFSDIRGFTAFSEKVKAVEVVDMLNEYFKIMVSIITKHHGVVDKFIGDAIMGVWGAPKSFGNDCENAIRACLEMRTALAKLNETRIARGHDPLMIGMGVHTGDLIAGTIGSDDRMEYTVIGDTVNQASRIESATKAYGTDLLISDATYEKIKDKFITTLAGTAEVKGKAEPIKLYKITGYLDEKGNPVTIETPYSSYKAEKADKIKAV